MQWWCSATGVAWSWTWQAYPGVWLFIGLIAFAYARLVRRLRREGESVPTSRIAAFAGGTLTLWLALDWPIGLLGASYLSSVHMLQFLMIALTVPPLLLFGIPEAAYRRIPQGTATALRYLTHPLITFVAFYATVIVTHLPITVDTLMATQVGSFVFDMTWLIAGTIYWWPIVAPVPERPGMKGLAKIGYLAAEMVAMTPVAFSLTFSDYPLYATYELAPRVHGFEALQDQQAAGLLMKLLGMLIYFSAVGILFIRWFRREEREEQQNRREATAGSQ